MGFEFGGFLLAVVLGVGVEGSIVVKFFKFEKRLSVFDNEIILDS